MITKKELDSVLSTRYQPALWRQVLADVFGARNLNRQPQSISLPANMLAKSAFELGFFNTTDDRIIGLYQIDLKPNVRIERNKVGLRELLRNVYKHDVDGALVVFVQGDKWRLSFISEVRVLNDDGSVDKKATEPKRYTYLLGIGEKTRTPIDRLAELSGKPLSLEDIRAAFSVEALNAEFYKKVSEQFYKLVGSTTGKGKKTFKHEQVLTLPGISAKSSPDQKFYKEFAVRLIGRTVFCWFLKVKQSGQGLSLLPEHLLSSEAVRENKNYYHTILEPLFFQTLNTKIEDRIADLPEGCEQIPFLNGGLFEPQPEDFYEYSKASGYSKHLDTLKIPDDWFAEFFEKLEQYNFTIDENSALDVEISVDPEMLGRIFENLLAEIDPDSGETARKATGSFYTPREIVNYMVDESLLIYLKGKLQSETVGFQALAKPQATMWGNESRKGQFELEQPLGQNRWQGDDKKAEAVLRRLFSYGEDENPFSDTETEILLKAIDNCKILDPACGSGAFPMGVLHRLVHLLGKLDRDNAKWKEWQKRKAIEATREAFEIGDKDERGKRLAEINDVFANNEDDYGRKIFLIENCIYGVDIQPIAAEISKLRCFLTLIVDETIDDGKENRGVKPLPNLEFKFVTADALLRLPESGLFNSDAQLAELQKIRHEYLQSYGAKKSELKGKFKELQGGILNKQIDNYRDLKDELAFKLSTWKPFEHEKTDWFDPLWMFGVTSFDTVIGNPPYGTSIKGSYRKDVESSLGKVPDYEIYYYFIERSRQVLSTGGVLSFIVPNTYLFNTFAENYRKTLLDNWQIVEILDCSSFPIFQSAVVRNTINTWRKGSTTQVGYRGTSNVTKFDDLINRAKTSISKADLLKFNKNWGLAFKLDKKVISVLNKIARWKHLHNYFDVSQGYIPYRRSDLIKSFGKIEGNKIVDERLWHSTTKLDETYKQEIFGKDITKYDYQTTHSYVKYGKHLAGYIDPRFFNQKRLLIREITNPQIIACLIEEELVNDPQLISIIPKLNSTTDASASIKSLWAVLNSQLATFYHFNSSPKATKGAFPKILIKDIKEFPLPASYNLRRLDNLVDYNFTLKKTEGSKQVNEYVPNSHLIEQFEEVMDALVYELYFEEDFSREDIAFLKYAERDFPPIEGLSREKKIETIHAAYQKLRQKDNEIRNNLKLMDIRLADLIMPIKTAR